MNVFSGNSEDLNYQVKNLLSDSIARHKIGKIILKYINVSAQMLMYFQLDVNFAVGDAGKHLEMGSYVNKYLQIRLVSSSGITTML